MAKRNKPHNGKQKPNSSTTAASANFRSGGETHAGIFTISGIYQLRGKGIIHSSDGNSTVNNRRKWKSPSGCSELHNRLGKTGDRCIDKMSRWFRA